jgi:Xaa-Pro dipeptidase
LQSRWEEALTVNGFQLAVVPAGYAQPYLFDDQTPVFRANPHLAQWLSSDACEGSVLLIEPNRQAQLLFLSPSDYWHQPPDPPHWLGDQVDVRVFADSDALDAELNQRVQHCARIAVVGDAGSSHLVGEANPAGLVNRLHYFRAYKTPFETHCMRQATAKAVAGHLAAAAAFDGGGSEFELQLAYMGASRQTESDLPYPNIVALNEHAGILHYQHYDRSPPSRRNSFLIDAGARHGNYAADITRTYAGAGAEASHGMFKALVAELDASQQALIKTIYVGQSYLQLHEDMHHRVGDLLHSAELISCSAEAAFAGGITRAFLPHGLGHLIGLQTHDVAGHQVNAEGTTEEPPETYQALRLTRKIEPDQVFTIEPGIYFIPQLLEELRAGPCAHDVQWPAVEALVAHGGIRIEDNVLITDSAVENFTRDAFRLAASTDNANSHSPASN